MKDYVEIMIPSVDAISPGKLGIAILGYLHAGKVVVVRLGESNKPFTCDDPNNYNRIDYESDS